MSMKFCQCLIANEIDEVEPCGNLVEGNTDMCASHNAFFRKLKKQNEKSIEKRNSQIAKAQKRNHEPRKTISKNPKDWRNTMYCSDGTKVGQKEINERLRRSYSISNQGVVCEGCGTGATSHAHIISQARCKALCKTELIWNPNNYFPACFACNSAIENPKGNDWKRLRNIEKCLSFIKQHDPELYMKFELSAVNQERETI